MFSVAQLSALGAPDAAPRASSPSAASGRSPRPRAWRDEVDFVLALDDAACSTSCSPSDAPADRTARDRRRPSRWSCTPRARPRRRRASCTRATRCATRPRASPGAGSSRGDDVSLVVCEFGFVGALRLRLLPGAAARRHRRADDALGRRGGAAPRRAPPLHVRAADADPRRRHAAGRAGERARPVLDARARRPGPDARAPRWRCARRSASPPLADYGLSEVPGHAAHGLRRARGEDGQDRGPALRRHRDPHPRPRRRAAAARARSATWSSTGRAASSASSATTS